MKDEKSRINCVNYEGWTTPRLEKGKKVKKGGRRWFDLRSPWKIYYSSPKAPCKCLFPLFSPKKSKRGMRLFFFVLNFHVEDSYTMRGSVLQCPLRHCTWRESSIITGEPPPLRRISLNWSLECDCTLYAFACIDLDTSSTSIFSFSLSFSFGILRSFSLSFSLTPEYFYNAFSLPGIRCIF